MCRPQEVGNLFNLSDPFQSSLSELLQVATELAKTSTGERAPVLGFRRWKIDIASRLKVVSHKYLTTVSNSILNRLKKQGGLIQIFDEQEVGTNVDRMSNSTLQHPVLQLP